MKNLLVPVDFSAVTDKVIDSTVALARAFQGRVILLHVIQVPLIPSGDYSLPVDVVNTAVLASTKIAEEKIASYLKTFREAGIEASRDILVGHPVTLILKEAKKVGADYVIMGSHGHGKLYDFFVGSTASGVIKKATCGVIILPRADKES